MTLPLALLAWLALAAFGVLAAAAGALWAWAHAAAALRLARDERRHLLALTDDWIWETDAEHRLVAWRAPAQRVAADMPAPALGTALADLVTGASAADAGSPTAADTASPIAAALAARVPIAELDVALGLDGTARPWTLRAEPRHDVAGRFVGYIGSARPGDAAAGAAIARTLLTLLRPGFAAAAEPAPALPAAAVEPTPAAIDAADHESFIYSVSHDLRAPIRVVEGFARILKEDYGRFLDRIGNDHTDRILAAAARMNSMIDALLALSRLQSQPLKRQPVDLSQLARYILDDLRSGEPERDAEIHIEPGLVIQGDPTLIRIAIENLVGNAWKYSGQSAKTRIELRRETLQGQPTFIVADAGAGFDMRFADRLFGVFQRLHSAKDFQGTGVGLASVRRIIRRHGGDIWAESEVGKGARFFFTLP